MIVLQSFYLSPTHPHPHTPLAREYSHSVPKFGVAFCEASQGHDPNVPGRLVRTEGNDDDLVDLAAQNALSLGAGHTFIVFIQGSFPISILNSIKSAPTVCRVYCATANPTTVLLTELEKGRRGILGVVDGMTSIGIESEKDKEYRKNFLRTIGYKR
jgi:adenosine/AMP kinase